MDQRSKAKNHKKWEMSKKNNRDEEEFIHDFFLIFEKKKEQSFFAYPLSSGLMSYQLNFWLSNE